MVGFDTLEIQMTNHDLYTIVHHIYPYSYYKRLLLKLNRHVTVVVGWVAKVLKRFEPRTLNSPRQPVNPATENLSEIGVREGLVVMARL